MVPDVFWLNMTLLPFCVVLVWNAQLNCFLQFDQSFSIHSAQTVGKLLLLPLWAPDRNYLQWVSEWLVCFCSLASCEWCHFLNLKSAAACNISSGSLKKNVLLSGELFWDSGDWINIWTCSCKQNVYCSFYNIWKENIVRKFENLNVPRFPIQKH